ncbi:MAG TPA: MFS transporter [Acidimicrobiales bacterium]
MSTGGATGPAGPLRYPAFLGALGARSISQAGSWIQTVAVGWLAFHLTHQAVAVGLIALLSLLPPVVLSEPGVVLDNRFGVRRVTMLLYGLQVLPAGALAVAAAVGHLTIIELYVATASYSIAAALARPGLQRLIPTTVPAAVRDRAIALEDTAFHLARLAGALVGGALLATSGAAPCFAVNSVSFLVVVLMIGITRFDLDHIRRSRAQSVKTRQWLREIRQRADLRALAIILVAAAALGRPTQSLAPVIADRYSTSPLFLGILVSAFALGGMVASLILARLERRDLSSRPVLAAATFMCGLAIAALATLPPRPLSLVTAACVGGLTSILYIVSLSWLQLDAAEGLAPHLIGLFFAIMAAGSAVGAAAIGGLADAVGIQWALVPGAVILTGLGTFRLWRTRLYGVRSPDGQ